MPTPSAAPAISERAVNIIRQLSEQRKLLGISQYRLAKTIGISQPTLSRIDEKACGLQFYTVLRIADALGLDLVLVPKSQNPE